MENLKKGKKLFYNDVAYLRQPDGSRELLTAVEAALFEETQRLSRKKYFCPGVVEGKECLAPMTLVHRKIPKDIWFFRCEGGDHINECPYCSEVRQKTVTTLSNDPENVNLEKQLERLKTLEEIEAEKIKRRGKIEEYEDEPYGGDVDDGDSQPRIIDIIIQTVTNPQKLAECYKVLNNSMKNDITSDGRRVEHIIIDHRTFESYRKGKFIMDKHGIVIAGGGVPKELSNEFITKMPYTIALKDPYYSIIEKKSIVYIIQFSTKELYKYFVGERRIIMSNRSLYLVLGKWSELNSAQNPGTRYYHCVIDKPGQIVKLRDCLEPPERLSPFYRMCIV